MKTIVSTMLLALALSSCDLDKYSPEPVPNTPMITAYVHWQSQGISGIELTLLRARTTRYTDSTGRALFIEPYSTDTLRAYGINHAGPVGSYMDYVVKVTAATTDTTLDIVDCLPCVEAGE